MPPNSPPSGLDAGSPEAQPSDSAPTKGLDALVRAAGFEPFYSSAKGDYVLISGDCRVVLPQLTAASICPTLVFADPPYHLSNDGVTCKSGKMVSVNKGAWDKSEGAAADHDFVLSWLSACFSCLAYGGSLWVSGTHHIIFSVGYGIQELGGKILNTVVWEKTAPPPNLSCRYYTHSHELVIWAKRHNKEPHIFNYAFEKEANGGKQQKDIWYRRDRSSQEGEGRLPNHWRIGAPRKAEKVLGAHPTQKPLELLERIVRCSSNPQDLVLDPFCGSGTTGVAALANGRHFIGIDLDEGHLELAKSRASAIRSRL